MTKPTTSDAAGAVLPDWLLAMHSYMQLDESIRKASELDAAPAPKESP